jgi:hypothetical protein
MTDPQSAGMSAIETAIGTFSSVAIAQAILWWNGVEISHALAWNVEILALTSAARFGWRRIFARRA